MKLDPSRATYQIPACLKFSGLMKIKFLDVIGHKKNGESFQSVHLDVCGNNNFQKCLKLITKVDRYI